MKLHLLLFVTFFVLLKCSTSAAEKNIDDVCLAQHLSRLQFIDESLSIHNNSHKRCQKFIHSTTENYYKFWKNHWKNQTPIENSDESVKCFINEARKYHIHDRYMLDTLLRERVAKLKTLLQRNSIFYDRMLKEFEKTCSLKGYYSRA